jgi:two-component system NtrC family sensor kinase
MKDSQITDQGFLNLRKRILTSILAPSLIPLVLVSAIILYEFYCSYQTKVHEHLAQIVLNHKQNIDTFLRERLANIEVVADNYSFATLKKPGFLQKQLDVLQGECNNVFVDIGLVNAQGVQVAYAGPFQLKDAVYSKAGWFENALEHEHTISDVFLGKRGFPHFIVTVRRVEEGNPWILRATIDFGAFNTLVQRTRIGKTGFAFIINTHGEFQTQPFKNIDPNKEPYTELIESVDHSMKVTQKKAQSGYENIFALSPLKNGSWFLVYQQQLSEAFHELNNTITLAGIIVFLGALGILTMALVLSSRMVLRIKQVTLEKEAMNVQVVEAGKMAAVGELAAGIAHEINNPVAIMVEEAGWVDDLIGEQEFKDSDDFDEIKRALREIAVQGKRTKEITHKLLSFARKTDSRTREVNLKDLLEEISGITAQRAKLNSVAMRLDVAEELPLVKASPTEMQQVFLNLINNALDAMEKQGGELLITARSEDSQVVIETRDTGPGIPESEISRIFDPFYTTKPTGKGTGLGLSICYGIISKMGGELKVMSELGKGTTFIIVLPNVKTHQDRDTAEEKNLISSNEQSEL